MGSGVHDPLRARQDLLHSEERFRLLVENLKGYAIVMLDPDGIVMSWNTGAERLLGYRLEEILGQPVSVLHAPDAPTSAEDALHEAARRGQFREEAWRTRKDGTRFWADVTLTALYDEAGALRGFASITHDMTENRRAAEEIRTLNAELEQRVLDRTAELARAYRELESFSYSVSHDLRAPLRAIDGFGKALLSHAEGSLDEQGRHYLTRIRAATQRMADLIDDLLELSRVSRAELRREDVDLSELARGVIAELRRRDPEREGRVTSVVAPGLVARADRRLLTILLENLLGNAWKFSSRQETARVEVGRAEGHPEAPFFVRDDGAGFDMALADKLFAPFQRLHEPAEFEGTGIGLATANRIVARHGGRIWAEAAPGRGATFSFTLG